MDLKRLYIAWRQNNKNQVFENVEIISFHLPKTGGVSFRNALESIYKNKLLLLYGNPFQDLINNKNNIWVPQKTKAIHGHFHPNHKLIEQFPNAKWVLWLRPPQQRIISHYNYWKAKPQPGKMYEIFKNEVHSFRDFVLSKKLHNQVCLYQTYFKKSDLNKFYFIGDLNNFDEDMKRFGTLFNLQMPPLKKLNQSTKSSIEDYTFDTEMLDAIKGEIEIYNNAVSKFGVL